MSGLTHGGGSLLGEAFLGVRKEAEEAFLKVRDPQEENRERVEEFLSFVPPQGGVGGVLVVSSQARPLAEGSTGIALTDPPALCDLLGKSIPGPPDPEARVLWETLKEVREALSFPPWRALFEVWSLASAIPWIFEEVGRKEEGRGVPPPESFPHLMPTTWSEAVQRLEGILQKFRPTVVVALGRVAFQAIVESSTSGRFLAEEGGLERLQIVPRWGATGRSYPWIEFRTFRSRFVPLPPLLSPLADRTRSEIASLAADSWRAGQSTYRTAALALSG